MTPATLLADLSGRGVRLSLDSGRLVIDAPRGTLTDADRAALAAHKFALVVILNPGEPTPDPDDFAAVLAADEARAALRWGPAMNDPEPGIVVARTDLGRVVAVLKAADLTDPYAVAERHALQTED